ncbi:hypothetical protein [Micromonospora sp. NPDC000442]|uniref:hypothetical protein n=1 Tax=Micromonospora sp. NPDC000442 TaxID=3364217 RepID=UPI00368B3924
MSDAARGVLVAMVPLLYGTGALSFPALLGLVTAAGLAGVPYAVSQRVLAGDLAGDDQRALTRAHGLFDTVYNAAGLGGPILAGIRHMRADPFLGRTISATIAGGFVLRFLAICLPLLAFQRYGGHAASPASRPSADYAQALWPSR